VAAKPPLPTVIQLLFSSLRIHAKDRFDLGHSFILVGEFTDAAHGVSIGIYIVTQQIFGSIGIIRIGTECDEIEELFPVRWGDRATQKLPVLDNLPDSLERFRVALRRLICVRCLMRGHVQLPNYVRSNDRHFRTKLVPHQGNAASSRSIKARWFLWLIWLHTFEHVFLKRLHDRRRETHTAERFLPSS
jgi:hypothetical protein